MVSASALKTNTSMEMGCAIPARWWGVLDAWKEKPMSANNASIKGLPKLWMVSASAYWIKKNLIILGFVITVMWLDVLLAIIIRINVSVVWIQMLL